MVSVRPHWPALRAALITAFVTINLLAAVPKPTRLDTTLLERPEAKQELARWAGVLSKLGVAIEPQALGVHAMEVSEVWLAARRWLLAPYEPVLLLTQTQQGWALFAYPDRTPTRFEVAWRAEKGDWQVIYLTGHPEHSWTEGRFRYRRVRAMHNPGAKLPPPLIGLTRALTAEWGSAEPTAAEVRFRLLQRYTELPSEPRKRIPVERWKKLRSVERAP